MNNQATSLLGADTVNSINNTAKMAGSFFNGGGQLPKPMGGAGQNSLASSAPVNAMGSSQGNMGWFNPNGSGANNAGGLLGYGLKKATQMFADGGTVGDPAGQGTPMVADEVTKIDQNWQAFLASIRYQNVPENVVADELRKYQLARQDAIQRKLNTAKQLGSLPPQMGQSAQGQPAPSGDANGNGIPDNMEKTITIKTRPIVQQQPQQEDPQPYSGAGMARPF